jgi:vacuolar-type H+-ATPase subunit H
MASPNAAPVGSLDELKRVKDAETEWVNRLRTAREEAEATLKRLREDTEGRIGLARTAAHQAREERVRAAQQEADREAAQVLANGDRQAQVAMAEVGKRPTDRREEILSAVLGEFRPD